jgi:hypothetical protein
MADLENLPPVGHAAAAAPGSVPDNEAAVSRGRHREAEAWHVHVPEQRALGTGLGARLLHERRRQFGPHDGPFPKRHVARQ